MNTDTPIVVGAFVTITGSFLAIAKLMLNQATKDREADRSERIKLSDAITLMAENSGEQTVATKEGFDKLSKTGERTADEARERNGHLAEQTLIVGSIAKKGIELQQKTLKRLEDSATLLVKDTKATADAVEEKRVIAQEDRDVLTNSDKHIRDEVTKIMDKGKE